MENLDIRFLGDMQRLQPQPGDVYVLTVPQCICDKTAERLRSYVSNRIGCPADKVLVLGDGLKMEVVSAMPNPPTITMNVNASPAMSREAALAQGREIARGMARAASRNS